MGLNPGLINLWSEEKKELALAELRRIQSKGNVSNDDPAVVLLEEILDDFYRDVRSQERKQYQR